MTLLEERAGWDREATIAHAVRLAQEGFGIVRVCHPLDPGGIWPCSEGPGHRDRLSGSPCASPGKRPISTDWESTAQREPDMVATMLSNPGNHSYGVMPPPGVFIWDVDGDVPERLKQLQRTLGPLPATRVHASGNGKHAVYRWPSALPCPGGNPFDIVTRWPGKGMVVGPGSVHAGTGTLYTVESDLPIAELREAWAHKKPTGRGGAGHLGRPR